jgi:hypothetical protein
MAEQQINNADNWSEWLQSNDIERMHLLDDMVGKIDPAHAADDIDRYLNNFLDGFDIFLLVSQVFNWSVEDYHAITDKL